MRPQGNLSPATATGILIGSITVSLAILKTTGIIKWSWLWIFAPAWIGAGIALLVLLIIMAFFWAAER